MKSIEQVLGFIEGWELAISTDNEELDKDNQVLKTLKEIWAYACIDPIEPHSPKKIDSSTPIWKKIQYDLEGKPIIPDNSVVRDGYYIDIISLDRLPKEQ